MTTPMPALSTARSPATVLIVDDEQLNRRLLEALLGPEGYDTRTAASGKEALDSIVQDPPDLILLDVMMPGLDGRQVASLLKADPATRNIPIIMVTAQSDREARLAALDAGAEEFLTKPVDRAELWLRVRNLLRLKELSDLLENHRGILESEVQARTADLAARTTELQASTTELMSRTEDLQRFRTSMDATDEGIFLICPTTMRFLEVNATASKMLGYSREELLEMGPLDLVSTSPERVEAAFDEIIASEGRTASIETITRRDGFAFPAEVNRHSQRAGAEWIIVEVVRDITERVEADTRLHHLAHFDALTGLVNRTRFHETLIKVLANASTGRQSVAVLFLDLDNFKIINDTYGHAMGDELLIQVSDRLIKCVRVRDTVGRLGGDEFALILSVQKGPADAAAVAEKIRAELLEPFSLDGRDVNVTASIGITLYPDDAADAATLLKYADAAMYQAKNGGRDAFQFFTSGMNSEVWRRLELENALRYAVKHGEFVMHYQPQLGLVSGQIVGLEALARWDRPGFGLVQPGEFINALEDSGLIVEFGRWAIAAVCEQIGKWMGSGIGSVQVAVNVSSLQFVRGDLEGDILRALDRYDVPAVLLEIELTESLLVTSTGPTIATLRNLKATGVQISIDDFGTGYSSLAYLRRFPIDKLKLDASFIRDITNPDDAAIALAIIQMGHNLHLEVIAEGVETAAQLAFLRRHQCDQIQGYYFSRPLPVPAIEQLLLAHTTLPPPEGQSELAAALDSTIQLLLTEGESWWAAWLADNRDRLIKGDTQALEHLLSAFGGMGSLNDLFIARASRHRVPTDQDAATDALLNDMRNQIWSVANKLLDNLHPLGR